MDARELNQLLSDHPFTRALEQGQVDQAAFGDLCETLRVAANGQHNKRCIDRETAAHLFELLVSIHRHGEISDVDECFDDIDRIVMGQMLAWHEPWEAAPLQGLFQNSESQTGESLRQRLFDNQFCMELLHNDVDPGWFDDLCEIFRESIRSETPSPTVDKEVVYTLFEAFTIMRNKSRVVGKSLSPEECNEVEGMMPVLTEVAIKWFLVKREQRNNDK